MPTPKSIAASAESHHVTTNDFSTMSPYADIRLPFTPLANHSLPSLFHIFDERGKKQNIDTLISGPSKEIWIKGLDNEIGRLSKGLPNKLKGTETIDFIHKTEIPVGRK